MKERLQKLLTVKSIVTFALTGVFCYLAIVGQMSTEFLTIYTMIMLNDPPKMVHRSTKYLKASR